MFTLDPFTHAFKSFMNRVGFERGPALNRAQRREQSKWIRRQHKRKKHER